MRFDTEAQPLFDEWLTDHELSVRSSAEHEAFTAHLVKYKKLVPALALVLHIADRGHGPVSAEAFKRAAACTEYLESHARRVYSAGKTSPTAAASLLEHVKADRVPQPFTVREVYNGHHWAGLSTSEQVREAVAELESAGYLRKSRIPTGGQPRVEFTLNPKVQLEGNIDG